ncbi:hypothetical protein POM88_007953 [Heracleum sosnowskyi]|uniref:Uncharacterized protein n=1 Tax=Heracleum sosnowskyi TaxID=360622 RepID=A0AAD8J5C1_9APIA|nr:hypothetical protein POM88_007953 [Heracleum sosnowskyi]
MQQARYMFRLALLNREKYAQGVEKGGANLKSLTLEAVWQELANARYVECQNKSTLRLCEKQSLKIAAIRDFGDGDRTPLVNTIQVEETRWWIFVISSICQAKSEITYMTEEDYRTCRSIYFILPLKKVSLHSRRCDHYIVAFL